MYLVASLRFTQDGIVEMNQESSLYQQGLSLSKKRI